MLLKNAIQTPDGTILVSRYTHDYQEYKDKNGKYYFIDGGLQYSRRSNNGDEIDLCVYTTDDFEKIREYCEWGTYGKKGNEPLHYIALQDLSTNHIKRIIETQMLSPEKAEVFKKELKYRKENK